MDTTLDIGQQEAERICAAWPRRGILAGVASGGSLAGALRIVEQTENAVIVFIVCIVVTAPHGLICPGYRWLC